ncbi:hypothetical protein J5E42_04280 [Mammaliicoccus vitulinus]|uniref:hypothetical protein n=1 Tax=Mammaliicoccus vitulinus TaxID=71237 RepID=UPI001AADAB8D|nr:hypothetical protein [Mammaliicoccus vitulinus]MBO3076729.1 hypothetical protein [Mammaliicoccus vitulinus]
MEQTNIQDTVHLCIKDTVIDEYAGEQYNIYPTRIVTRDGKVFNYVTQNGHLLSEEFKNKHFIEWSEYE